MCGLGSGRLRVVLLDPRGTGALRTARRAAATSSREYAGDLDALRSANSGLERIDLLGHSHGGFVGMTYALAYPDGLGRLVLACSAPRFSPEQAAEAEVAYERHAGERWYADAREAQRQRTGVAESTAPRRPSSSICARSGSGFTRAARAPKRS